MYICKLPPIDLVILAIVSAERITVYCWTSSRLHRRKELISSALSGAVTKWVQQGEPAKFLLIISASTVRLFEDLQEDGLILMEKRPGRGAHQCNR